MAKSPGFYSKRRGSAGDFTYSILNGKQITKQKVSQMGNPQSSKQATQRLRILCAQRFLSAFGNELNHSFENVAVGRKSKQHFLSLAMRTTPVCPMEKGALGFMPETYVISEGQLPKLAAVCDPTTSDLSAKFDRVYFDAEETSTIAKLVEKNGWNMGDQLTVFGVIAEKDSYDSEMTAAVVDRVILDENTQIGGGAVVNFENQQFALNITTGELSFEGEVGFENQQLVGIAVVRTHADQAAGKFRYSSETMDVAESWKSNGASNFGPARASYMKAAKALDSELYMRQAESQQAAAIVYSNPRGALDVSEDATTATPTIYLIVDGSDGKQHAVYNGSSCMQSEWGDSLESSTSAIPISGMVAAGEEYGADSQLKPLSPSLHYLPTEGVTKYTVGEAVTLGEPVNFVAIAEMIFNA